MLPQRADEQAALVFSDLASALDAGLPLSAVGGADAGGDDVLVQLCLGRGIRLRPTERLALVAGWKSGSGAAALRGRAAARRRRAAFLRAAIGAVTYPAVLFLLLLVASFATMAIVGPAVAIVLAVLYAGVGAALVLMSRKLGRGDASLASYPVVGGVVREMQELPYLEGLHALYSAGVPIVDAHRAATATVKMQGLRAQLGLAQKMLDQGKPLHDALQATASLSQETRTLLATGERAGELEDALDRALARRAEMAERRLQTAARALGAIAYGVAVVGVAAIVILFYTNYYAPILGMMR